MCFCGTSLFSSQVQCVVTVVFGAWLLPSRVFEDFKVWSFRALSFIAWSYRILVPVVAYRQCVVSAAEQRRIAAKPSRSYHNLAHPVSYSG